MSLENCGYPDGVVHAHTDVCHRAGIDLGRQMERSEIVAFLRGRSPALPQDVQGGPVDAAPPPPAVTGDDYREPRPLGWLFNRGRGSRG